MKKLTSLEKSWILYDVANSAFVLMVSTIMPIYFEYLCGLGGISSEDYLAYWGYAASAATLIVALIGPVLGTMADRKDSKKKLFMTTLLVGVIGCAVLGFMTSWILFIVVYIITKVGYSACNIFYDAMLTDVTTPERMDNVSSQGYAWGYIGSCIPFAVGLVLVLNATGFGISMATAMAIALMITAVWWFGLTMPLLKKYKQTNYIEPTEHAVADSFRQIIETVKDLVKSENKGLLWFFIAYFFYIDGVYTIIEMATAYGKALGLDSTGLLLALLVTQLVAFPCSIIFGRLAKKYKNSLLISICIVAYTGITIFAFFMTMQWQFWLLAVCVGMFQGGVQALSRSYFAKIIPPEKSGNYFGLLDICGKGASFLGTLAVGAMTQLTGSSNKGISVLILFFAIGFVLFRKSVKESTVNI